MSDVDFSQVRGVKIKEGEVRYINNWADGRLYWKRPMTYPVFSFCLRSSFSVLRGSIVQPVHVYSVSQVLIDRYGVTKYLETANGGKNSDGSMNVYYPTYQVLLPSDDDEIDGNDYASSFTQIKKGMENNNLSLVAYVVNNDSETKNCPESMAKIILNYVSYKFSDATTKKIKLYAIPSSTSLSENKWTTYHYQYRYSEPILFDREHETDVIVDAGTPLMTAAYWKNGEYRITSVRSNFDEYKTKYDTATGGAYPKNSYPYLVGVITLEGVHQNIENKNTCKMYIAFKVKR